MKGPFFDALRDEVQELGGFLNGHLHLCRAGSHQETRRALDDATDSHLSLAAKHGLIPLIHGSESFQSDRYGERVRYFLSLMIEAGTRRADTLVDVASGTLGSSTFEQLSEIKEALASEIELQLGSYCPLGFRDDRPEQWELVAKMAERADFIGALPERDDRRMYPEHVGFRESVRRVLELSARTAKPLHMHVDQKNDPAEDACEIVLQEMEAMGGSHSERPRVWFIHAISPSAYDEGRFQTLVARMKAASVGVICCPSAALSMRQLRDVNAPTHNSIARALDFLAAGIPVRLASDNINDITSPAGTADLMDELFVFCNALRFYDVPILARVAAGQALTSRQRALIREHLELDARERQDAIAFTRSEPTPDA